MTTAGPRYPATVTTASVSTESANDWLTASNIGADDGSEAQITAATYDSPDISFRLIGSNFGFTIPTGATIDGITVAIDRRCFAGAAEDFRVQLLDETGALVGDNKADTVTAWPGTLGTVSYGGATDKWNWTTVTPTKLNDADFGVVLSVAATAANTDIGVDFIRVTVDYTVTFSTLERSAAIAATAAVASAATFFTVFERTSAIGATATVASAGEAFTLFERSAAVGATAAVASVGQRDLLRSAALGTTATVVTAGQRDLLRSSAIGATATVQAGSMRDLLRSAALSATGSVATAGQRDLLRSVLIGSTGTVTAAGEVAPAAQTYERSAALAALAAVSVSGHRDPSSTGGTVGSSSTGGGVTSSGTGGVTRATGTEGAITTTGRVGG